MNLDAVFDGREETGINITHQTKHFRFEINRSTGWPTTALFVIQSTWSNTSGHTGEVTLETWDGSAWIQRDSWVYSNFQRGYNLHTTTQVHNGQNSMRVTIKMDWTDATHNYIPLRRILLLSNYSGSIYDMQPFYWNYNKEVTFASSINVSGGNSGNWNTAYGWGDHGAQGYATTTYVDTAVSNLVDSAPATLDTLNELAAALGDDANFSTTVTNSIATKLPFETYDSGTDLDQINRGTFGAMNTGNNSTNRHQNYAGVYSLGVAGVANTLQLGTASDYNASGLWVRQYNQNAASPQGIGWQNWTKVWTDNDFANNSANWDTAYGWGNHASAGYLTSVPVPVNGDWWNNGFVRVLTDGVMEMGKYMDFHTSDSGGNADFDLRVTASPGTFSIGGVVNATGGTITGNYSVTGRTTSGFLQIGGDTSSSSTYIYDGYTDGGSAYFHQPSALVRTDSSATGGIDEGPVSLALFNRNGANNTWIKLALASREAEGNGNTVTVAGIAARKTAGTANNWASGELHLFTKNGAAHVTNMVLTPNGNVGIGTDSPGQKLEINQGGTNNGEVVRMRYNASYYTDYGSNQINFTGTSQTFAFKSNGTDVVRLASNGDVGIGTTSPSYKLDVNGTVRATGHVYANSDVNLNGGGYLRFTVGSAAASGFTVYNAAENGYLSNRITTDAHARGWGWELTNSNAVSTSSVAYHRFAYGGTSVSWLANGTGNVGIGTTTPAQKLSVYGDMSATDQISVNNRTAISVAHWSASGNSTGAIRITMPGSHSSNWSMIVLRITAYEYNSTAHTVYYVSGHDWTSGWYNNGVTKIGTSNKDIRLAYDSNKDYVVLGDVGSVWTYGHVTVDVMAHPAFYNGNMDITSGWDIRQTTDLSGITTQTVTNKRVLTTADEGSGNGIDADTVDGLQASSFLRSDTTDTATGALTLSNTGNHYNGHHYFDAYDANGNHYPHYQSGSNANGAVVHTRVYTDATNYKVFKIDAKNNAVSWDGNNLATESYVTTALTAYKTSDDTETYVAAELLSYTPTSSFGTNAFTSYTDHVGLYDALGDAQDVQDNLDAVVGSLGTLAYSSATIPTNNNQLTNGAGYITGYTETDTLASVTGRGASTTTNISVRGITARTIVPESDRSYNLGADSSRWQIIFCETLDSAGQHESNLQNPEGEKAIGEYETGTVLVWKGGKNVPCTKAADHMRMGIAVKGIDSPLIQGAEPVLVTGSVNEGDYLVTSTTEGHAEAISPEFMRQHMLFDCVIGKALESGDGDSHLIKTWINI